MKRSVAGLLSVWALTMTALPAAASACPDEKKPTKPSVMCPDEKKPAKPSLACPDEKKPTKPSLA